MKNEKVKDLHIVKDFIKHLGDCEFSYLLRSMGYEIKERSILIEIESNAILIKFDTKPNQSLQDAFINELKRILLGFMGESNSMTECQFRDGSNKQRLAFKLYYDLIKKLTISKCQ
jgi:hypothetical protein